MTTIAQLLADLNALRTHFNMPALKSWKKSRNELAHEIKQLELRRADEKSSDTSFASWCREHNINPKVARAKLRKANHPKVGTRYELNEAAIAIVKGK